VYLALGVDSSAAFIDWQRIASADDAESWILTSVDDPASDDFDTEILESLHRLPESFEVADTNLHSTIGADLYQAVHDTVRHDRILEWALRSSVEQQAELFYGWRDLLLTAPADDVVERLIDGCLSDIAAADEPNAIERGLSAIVDGSTFKLSEPNDVEHHRQRAKQYLTKVYWETRLQSDPAVQPTFIRELALRSLGNSWCRFLNVAAFIRRHVEEAYPSGDNWIADYRRDISNLFSQSIRDFRSEALRLILSTKV
jgi:hypothetical protein